MMKILLIEDEPTVAMVLNKGLTENGYGLSVAPDGTLGLDMALNNDFDVIILDIMLPGINGLQVCKAIREKNIQTPILFLTALGTTENIVAGLNMGADDYLVKPFKLAELEARLRTLARRKQPGSPVDQEFSFGDLHINLSSKLIHLGETRVNLTPTEFRLLEYFVRNPNKVLSRVDILEQVWSIDFNMGTNVVDVYINYLRKKIDKDPQHRMIQTVVGMGYMFKTP